MAYFPDLNPLQIHGITMNKATVIQNNAQHTVATV